MKKQIIVLFLFMIILSGCKGKSVIPDLSDGTYTAQNQNLCRVTFHNKEFIFTNNPKSSYRPHGEFECRDGKIIASDKERGGTYVFEIVDDKTIIFLKSESTETPLPEGFKFTLIE